MKIAVVKEIASGKERQIVQGYTINGLHLEQVEADSIVFTQYEDREEIRLKIQPSPKPYPAFRRPRGATRQIAGRPRLYRSGGAAASRRVGSQGHSAGPAVCPTAAFRQRRRRPWKSVSENPSC